MIVASISIRPESGSRLRSCVPVLYTKYGSAGRSHEPFDSFVEIACFTFLQLIWYVTKLKMARY
jgi:hypothetical protein